MWRLIRLPLAVLLVLVVGLVGVVRAVGPPSNTSIPPVVPGGIEVGERARGTYEVGRHTVVLGADAISISHPRARSDAWSSPRGRAFLVAGVSPTAVDGAGVVRVSDQPERTYADQRIEGADVDTDGRLVISGFLVEEETGEEVAYQMFLSSRPLLRDRLDLSLHVLDEEVNRLTLMTALESDERLHGMGAQYAPFDLRGGVHPIIPRDQGVGRGHQPLSLLVDLFGDGAGSVDTTTAPLPFWVTSAPRSLWASQDTVLVVDARPSERVALTAWAPEMLVSVGVGATPREHVTAHAQATGLMRRPPGWVGEGLVVSVRGGAEAAADTVARLASAGVGVAGIVVEDWAAGDGPSAWSEGVAEGRYGDLAGLVAEPARTLLTASPLLAGDSDLWSAAAEEGFLVLAEDGEPYDLGEGVGMVDLLDAEAAAWLARALADQVLVEGVAGFVAEGGEVLPVDAVTAIGEGAEARGLYAAAWAAVGRHALDLAALEEDGLVVVEAAGESSAGSATMFTTAPQLVDFSREDGLGSAFDGMMAAGMSGMALMHHAIGGETTLTLPGPLPDLTRSPELLVRSAELAAFSPMMRVAGGNRPDLGAQPGDAEVVGPLADLVSLFVALGPERARLGSDVQSRGLPLLRHPLLVVPEQPDVTDQPDVAFLGEDVFLAPVLTEHVDRRLVTLPAGSWVDVWTGEQVDVARNAAGEMEVEAPLGRPPAWARAGSSVADDLAAWRDAR